MEPNQTVEYSVLAEMVRRYRASRGLSLRDAASECRISPSTLSRIERGSARPDLDTVQLVTTWIGVEMDKVLSIKAAPRPPVRARRTNHQMASTIAQVEVHLRADPSLTDEAARALTDILQAAYKQFVGKERG